MSDRYTLEYKRERSSDGKQLTRVGITFEGKWCGYYKSFAGAMTCLTIRKVPPDEARAAVAKYWPHKG
jgi:hypothetical protein